MGDTRRSNPGRVRKRGFALIEILIAFGIVMFLAVGAVEMLVHALRSGAACRESVEAMDLAARRLEELKALDFDHPDLSPGSSEEEAAGSAGILCFRIRTTIDSLGEGLKLIEIECRLPARPRGEVRLAVYKSRWLGFRP
jgi:type II secretory pathway pseudopilin PulG